MKTWSLLSQLVLLLAPAALPAPPRWTLTKTMHVKAPEAAPPVFDTHTGFLVVAGRPFPYALRADGGLLAYAGADPAVFSRVTGRVAPLVAPLLRKSFSVWDVAAERPLWSVDLPNDAYGWDMALSLAFSPDGRVLAMGSAGGGLKLWDAQTGTLLRVLTGPASSPKATAAARAGLLAQPGRTVSVAFAPDGRTLVSAGGDGTLRVWDPATGALLHTLVTPGVQTLAFGPGGLTLLAGCGRDIEIWSYPDGRVRRVLCGHDGPVRSLAFSPTGGTLWSGAFDGTVKSWDWKTGQNTATYGRIQQAAVDGRGRTLAYSLGDGDVSLLDIRTGKTLRTLHGFFHPPGAGSFSHMVKTLALSPDGRMVAGGSFTTEGFIDHSGVFHSRVILWDAKRGRLRHQWEEDPSAQIVFSASGRQVAMMSPELTDTAPLIRVRALPGGHQLRDWNPLSGAGHPYGLGQSVITLNGAALGFLPQGRAVLAASGRGLTGVPTPPGLWDVMTGRRLWTAQGDGAYDVFDVSRDGRVVAGVGAAGGRRLIRLWDARVGRPRMTVGLPTSQAVGVFLSRNGREAAASAGPAVGYGTRPPMPLWIVTPKVGGPVTELSAPPGGLSLLSFSANGRQLIGVTGDGTVYVWSAG